MTIGTFKTLAGMALCGVALLSGCSSVPPGADRFLAPAPSSTWDYMQKNTGSYGRDLNYRFTRGEGTWRGQPVILLHSSLGTTTVIRPSDGNFMAVLGPDQRELMTWDPPLGMVFPLAKGATWSRRVTLTLGAGRPPLAFDWRCTVEDFGPTVVPAGRFEAFRVHCVNTVGTDETFWYSPALGALIKTSFKRDASSPFGIGTQDTEMVRQQIAH